MPAFLQAGAEESNILAKMVDVLAILFQTEDEDECGIFFNAIV
jgi:hypothetical protein